MNKKLAAAEYRQNKIALLLDREVEKSAYDISLCLYDFATGLWVERNARKQLYPASLIKILYLLTALCLVERGALSLGDSYTLTEKDKYAGKTRIAGTGILQSAAAGNRYTVEELLSLMICLSDNIAANIILELAGPQEVQAMAARLGLTGTRGTRKMFDLESSLPPNASTARELTEMLVALENGQLFGETMKDLALALLGRTKNKDRIGRYLRTSGVLVANKTGTVPHMVGDMALLYFPDRPPAALTIMVELPPSRFALANKFRRLAAAKTIGRLAFTAVNELRKASVPQ